MGYEVDFLPVKSGGAAICVRWGEAGRYKVLVYDAGTSVSGEHMVAHIEKLYMTSHVDYVVSSHPASDHMGGLEVVLRKLSVGELWMQRPWVHSERLRAAMAPARELEKLAETRGIPVHEPFAGGTIGPFVVLSPAYDWYMDALLPAFSTQPPGAGQAPNAGSLDHVSAKVLDRIVGQSKPASQRKYTKSAFVSLEGRQRLSRILTESLNRRGAITFATQGMSLHHWHGMPDRGWYRAKPTSREV